MQGPAEERDITTAWKTESAMSSRLTPVFIRDCTSVFANTPQREAMVWISFPFAARSLRPLASVESRMAIWSMKEPVPPAQAPFMRCSMVPRK